MFKNSVEKLVRSSTKTSPESPTTEIDKVYSHPEYKKFIFSNKCYCGTCEVLGSDFIKLIYELGHIIQDHDPSIYDPMNEIYHDKKVGVMVI